MKKTIFLLMGVALILLVAACGGGKVGSEYEGTWIMLGRGKDISKGIWRIEIARNDKDFIITHSQCMLDRTIDGWKSDFFGRKINISRIAVWIFPTESHSIAVFKEGNLETEKGEKFTFVKAKGEILAPDGKMFVKETPEKLNKLKEEVEMLAREKHPELEIRNSFKWETSNKN